MRKNFEGLSLGPFKWSHYHDPTSSGFLGMIHNSVVTTERESAKVKILATVHSKYASTFPQGVYLNVDKVLSLVEDQPKGDCDLFFKMVIRPYMSAPWGVPDNFGLGTLRFPGYNVPKGETPANNKTWGIYPIPERRVELVGDYEGDIYINPTAYTKGLGALKLIQGDDLSLTSDMEYVTGNEAYRQMVEMLTKPAHATRPMSPILDLANAELLSVAHNDWENKRIFTACGRNIPYECCGVPERYWALGNDTPVVDPRKFMAVLRAMKVITQEML